MDRILALVILLVLPFSSQAASTVVYPNFTGISTLTLDGAKTFAAASGSTIAANGVARFPGASSLFLGSMPVVSKAFSAEGLVSQSLARKVAVGALKAAPGLILTAWALDFGLSFYEGHWQKTSPPPPGGVCWEKTLTAPQQSFCNTFGPCLIQPNPAGTYSCSVTAASCGAGPTANGWGACYDAGVGSNPPSNTQPATEQDFDELENTGRDLTQAELQSMQAAGYAVPVNPPLTKIGDLSNLTAQELAELQGMGFFQPTPNSGAIKHGDPVKNPVTGQLEQPMLQLDPAPNAGVRVTPYSTPVDAAGNPALDPQGNPLPNTADSPDPCTLNPDRAGCAQLGTLDDATPAPTQTPVSITPEAAWGGAGQCPQDVVLNVMGQSVPFKFSGACQFFQLMNPVVLAAAWVSALFIFIGGVRTES